MASQYDVEVEVVNKNVPIGCTIVDVGSNAGYFAKEFLDLGYTVISIEPLKEEIIDFLECVKEGRVPRVSATVGRDALKVALEITEKINAAVGE